LETPRPRSSPLFPYTTLFRSGLENYRERHSITEPWETRERVLVAITGAPGTEALIRRAARMAQRSHGELLGVHVRNDDGLAGGGDRKSTRLNSSHRTISYAVF